MTSTPAVYARRRAQLAQAIGPGGIAIIPTAPEQQRNRDSDFLYRHDSYFYYLCGFAEPKAWLVITGTDRAPCFVNPRTWSVKSGTACAGARSRAGSAGAGRGLRCPELDTRLPKLMDGRDAVWYPFATHKGLETRMDGWLGGLRARVRYGTLCP
jgi:Xaa-Pro aminopeptidase